MIVELWILWMIITLPNSVEYKPVYTFDGEKAQDECWHWKGYAETITRDPWIRFECKPLQEGKR